MRAAALLAAMIGLAATPLTTRAAPAGAERLTVGPASGIVQVAENCGPGRHWVARYRDRAGRWIPGHCAPN